MRFTGRSPRTARERRDEDESDGNYTGARGSIWGNRGRERAAREWIFAADLVETTKLYGRTVATVDPKWL